MTMWMITSLNCLKLMIIYDQKCIHNEAANIGYRNHQRNGCNSNPSYHCRGNVTTLDNTNVPGKITQCLMTCLPEKYGFPVEKI